MTIKDYISAMKKSNRKYQISTLLFAAFGVLFIVLFIITENKLFALIDYWWLILLSLGGFLLMYVLTFHSDLRIFRRDIKAVGSYKTVIAALESAPMTDHGTFATVCTDELFAYLSEEGCRVLKKDSIISARIHELDSKTVVIITGSEEGEKEMQAATAGEISAQALCDFINKKVLNQDIA